MVSRKANRENLTVKFLGIRSFQRTKPLAFINGHGIAMPMRIGRWPPEHHLIWAKSVEQFTDELVKHFVLETKRSEKRYRFCLCLIHIFATMAEPAPSLAIAPI